MKKNYYANVQRGLAEMAEISKEEPKTIKQASGGIKIFAMHIPMEIYLSAKEMADLRNISMKQYVLEGLCKVIQEDAARGTIQND